MKETFTKIEQDIARLLDEQLLSDIHSFREERLARISDVISEMLDMLSYSGANETVGAGLQKLQAFLAYSEHEALHEQIIANIFILKNGLPKRVAFHQTPDHFEQLSSDDLSTKVLKRGKRLIRDMGKSEWLQKVPVQNVVAYHLLDSAWLFKNWLAAEDRFLMEVILELDQLLDYTAQDTENSSKNTKLKQLLKVLQNEIKEAQRSHKQKLAEARDTLLQMLVPIFDTVGTIERRAGFYTEKRVLKAKEQLKKELEEYQEQWKKVNRLLLERTLALHEFEAFCEHIEESTQKFKAVMSDIFNSSFHDPYHTLKNEIASAHRQTAHSEQPLAEILSENHHSLLKTIQEQLVKPLKESMEGVVIQQHIQSYTDHLREQALDLAKEVIFITDLDRGENPPKIQFKKIEWSTLVNWRLQDEVLDKVSLDEEDVEKFLSIQMREAKEIESIIEVNFESALDLSRKRATGDNPYKVVNEALDRAQSKNEKFESKAEEAQKELLEPLDTAVQQFKSGMFNLLYHADAKTLKLLDTKYKVSEKTLGWQTKARARWARVQDKSTVWARFGWQKGQAYFNRSSVWLGLQQPTLKEDKKANITAYLTETEQRFEELPYIYRRLFDFNEFTEERYYVGLNENFGHMQEALNQWENGLTTTMAVVGEKGSGKSTYLQLVQSKLLAEHNVLRIDLAKTTPTEAGLRAIFNEEFPEADFSSMEQLVQFLREEQHHRIIIFEGVQNLYVRQLNGYDAIEQFVYLIAETADDIFWLVSCSRYAWSFLSKAVNINEYFSHFVESDTLNEKQLQKAILGRHRASGYELAFATSESDAKNRSYRKLMDDEEKAQDYLKDKYFNQLAELSNGNTSIGMIFWLRSIQKFDDTHCYIAPLKVASLEMIEDLSPKLLFVLTSLVLHDTLNAEELSAVQNMNVQESRMVLKRLKNRGIVVDSGHGYYLNHLIYRQVIDELKNAIFTLVSNSYV